MNTQQEPSGKAATLSSFNPGLPVTLQLANLRVLLIGGNAAAQRCLAALLQEGANTQVTILSTHPNDRMSRLAAAHANLRICRREFEEEDLAGHDLVVIATDDLVLAKAFRDLARSRNLLTHVAGHPELSDFILGESRAAGAGNATGASSSPAYRKVKLNRKNVVLLVLAGLALMVTGHLLFSYIPFRVLGNLALDLAAEVDSEILIYILGGFVAQLIDGALGMAYGVSATTFLLSFGVSPVAASASVHASEIFTSGVSGLLHLKFGNVNSKLFKSIVVPGMIGAIIGAYLLFNMEEYLFVIKPLVACYTLVLGILILRKVLRKKQKKKPVRKIGLLATMGGFLDAIGGGGWGPIVSSTLIAKGRNPMYTIGSVNLAEFFVSVASSVTFITLIGITHWQVVVGLILGGMISAPLGALLARRLPVKTMMIFVGIVVIIVSLRLIVMAFWG